MASPSDRLLIFYQAPAFYLFWPHRVATNSIWLTSPRGFDVNDDPGPLPAATLAYYAREKTAPDVVVRVIDTAGLSRKELEQQYCGGLGYRLVRGQGAVRDLSPARRCGGAGPRVAAVVSCSV